MISAHVSPIVGFRPPPQWTGKLTYYIVLVGGDSIVLCRDFLLLHKSICRSRLLGYPLARERVQNCVLTSSRHGLVRIQYIIFHLNIIIRKYIKDKHDEVYTQA